MFYQCKQLRALAEEMLPNVGTGLDGVFHEFAVANLVHSLNECTGLVARQESIPVATPDHLDSIPTSAAKGGFEFLDDLSVTANGSVEPLQVAIDDKNEIVESLARCQGQCTERLGFIGLTVAEEAPDFLLGRVAQATMLEIAIEARLVYRGDCAEPHRHRRKLPEIRHQPGMRIGRQSAAWRQFAAKVLELRTRQSAFEKRACIDPRRGVTLKINLIAAILCIRPAKEMVQSNFT